MDIWNIFTHTSADIQSVAKNVTSCLTCEWRATSDFGTSSARISGEEPSWGAHLWAWLFLLMDKSLSSSSSLPGWGRVMGCKYQGDIYVSKNRAQKGTKVRKVLFVQGGNVIRMRILLSSLSDVCWSCFCCRNNTQYLDSCPLPRKISGISSVISVILY